MTATNHEGIFGTPPEPLFNVSPSSLSPDMLEDWLFILAKENSSYMKTAKPGKQGYFKQGDAAQFIFWCCEMFELKPESKYKALELFDRFMVQHLTDLYAYVLERKDTKKEWANIQDRVKKQMILRAVSCCQVASKLSSHYKAITPRKARNFLMKAGQRYSLENIMQSELRVLKTMEYKVAFSTPLLYVETLLEILGHNEYEVSVKVYHGVCLKLLDLYYILRREIYDKLYQLAGGIKQVERDDRHKFVAVEYDFLLLSASVIASSAYIVDQARTDKIVDQLSRITRIPGDDVLDFATVLMHYVVNRSEP